MKRIPLRAIALVLLAIGGQAFADQPIQVAIFKGDGVGPSVNDVIKSLGGSESPEFAIRRITADEIRSGKLAGVDVLIHPGGSGSGQGKALGEAGRKVVRAFVKDGGGFLGVCGGAYLATNDYSWSLNLIDAKAVDRKHWARGNGTVELQLSPVGSRSSATSVKKSTFTTVRGRYWGGASGTTRTCRTTKVSQSTRQGLRKKGLPKA